MPGFWFLLRRWFCFRCLFLFSLASFSFQLLSGKGSSIPRAAQYLQETAGSEKLEKAGTVDSKNTSHRRWGQGPGSVDPRSPAGLPFPVPEIPEFVAFRDSQKSFCSNSPGLSLEFSSGTPKQTPETATAFSSFLTGSFLGNFFAVFRCFLFCLRRSRAWEHSF